MRRSALIHPLKEKKYISAWSILDDVKAYDDDGDDSKKTKGRQSFNGPRRWARSHSARIDPVSPRRVHLHDECLPLRTLASLLAIAFWVDDRCKPAIGREVRHVYHARVVCIARRRGRVGGPELLADTFGVREVGVRVGEKGSAVNGCRDEGGRGGVGEGGRVIYVVVEQAIVTL